LKVLPLSVRIFTTVDPSLLMELCPRDRS